MVNQLQACLGSCSVFTQGTTQVRIGDDKVYALGYTPVAVISLNPSLRHVRETMHGGHIHHWRTDVEVCSQWRDAVSGPPALGSAWQSVFDQIDKYPYMGLGAGQGIRDVFVSAADLRPIVEDYGTVKFAHVKLTVDIQEDVTVAEAE